MKCMAAEKQTLEKCEYHAHCGRGDCKLWTSEEVLPIIS